MRLWTLVGFALAFLPGPMAAASTGYLDLPAVKPVVGCAALAKVNLGSIAGGRVAQTAATGQTPKGEFCKVAGELPSGFAFEVHLPVARWTQRLVQSAQGNLAVPNAGSCAPATEGEFVVAVNSRGGSRRREGWQTDPAKRIAFAYELNHQTALIAKALIKAYYGQPQRFAYLVGCSGGGREVLIEAQRYPEDFDGVSAGAPAILLNVHNGGFFHGWERHINRRADGSAILLHAHLPILHRAVLKHCAEAAALRDEVLQMPSACTFDPTWVRCKAGANTGADCLSAEAAAVAARLYRGSTDSAGRGFDMGGYPLGSELQWPLTTPDSLPPSRTGSELRYLLALPEADQSAEALDAAFRFDDVWFAKLGMLAPLYNGANTDLGRFARRGGKLLLWHGTVDPAVQQEAAIAYYQGVQRVLGAAATDRFARLFLLPGVAHCGGGAGPAQIDILSALMAWVERGQAPAMLLAGKTATQRSAIPGEAGLPPVGAAQRYPFAAPAQPATLTRPIFPFPMIARFIGSGDPNNPANYRAVPSPVRVPQVLNSRAEALIGPGNQANYRVVGGQLVTDRIRGAPR